MTILPYIVVIGGSYVGTNVAKQLATKFHDRFQVVVIEKNTHFHHLFAFPRFAVAGNVDTHKAFIPYSPGTFSECPPNAGSVIQATVTSIDDSYVCLDQEVKLGDSMTRRVPFQFLVIATGTKLSAPSTIPVAGKGAGVEYLRNHAQSIANSSRIAVLGGGAVGVQMALDIKEIHKDKSVTLIHSRDRLMHHFHPNLDRIIQDRCAELGVELVLKSRVRIPPKGFPSDGSMFQIDMEDGSQVAADFAIICTGQKPQSDLARSLSSKIVDEDGYIKVLKTLQVSDSLYPNIFAIGDVAATGAHKAAKPANKQAGIVVENIEHLLAGDALEDYEVIEPRGIHLTLGLQKNVAFGNPVEGATEPFTKHRDDGSYDMNIDRIWNRKAGGADFYA